MQLRLLNVAVDGGDLRVLLWGTGKRVAVVVHGITASGMSWQAVARHMPPDWTLAAPDLRGRGHSGDLPGPYGLDRHADSLREEIPPMLATLKAWVDKAVKQKAALVLVLDGDQ